MRHENIVEHLNKLKITTDKILSRQANANNKKDFWEHLKCSITKLVFYDSGSSFHHVVVYHTGNAPSYLEAVSKYENVESIIEDELELEGYEDVSVYLY